MSRTIERRSKPRPSLLPKCLFNFLKVSIPSPLDNISNDLQNSSFNYRHGLFGHRTRKSARDFKAPCIIAYFDEDLVDNLDKISYWRKRILKVARIFAGRINFAFCDKEDFPDEVGEFDFDFADGNPLILAHDSSHRTFRMTDEFSFDNLRNFATKVDNGGLESTISQESIPLMDSHVKVVGDESFEELVLENGKDTLVGIYAPWCADCEFLNPVFEEIAEKLKKEAVSIVQIDDTVVTPPKAFQSPFYPSILWLPKNDKSEPQPYTGRRQVQDIIKFIAEKATSELNGYDREGNEKPKRIQTVTKKVMKI